MGIRLLPLRNSVDVREAMETSNSNPTVVADCYIEGVERWKQVAWGWRTRIESREIFNIDHHAEDSRFYYPISSGNLAVRYVESEGVLPHDVPAIINHTDCDSIISAAILTGLLSPKQEFCDAVIAADHSGDPNPIADLLQALDPLRDIEFSLRNLNLLLREEPLDQQALDLLKIRRDEQGRAKALVESGRFHMLGSVAVAKLTAAERVAGEFLPGLLPQAAVIVSGSPMENGRWEIKARLGKAACPGATLFSLECGGSILPLAAAGTLVPPNGPAARRSIRFCSPGRSPKRSPLLRLFAGRLSGAQSKI